MDGAYFYGLTKSMQGRHSREIAEWSEAVESWQEHAEGLERDLKAETRENERLKGKIESHERTITHWRQFETRILGEVAGLKKDKVNLTKQVTDLMKERIEFALRALLNTADSLGNKAMFNLARKSLPDADLDTPSPDIPAPDGHRDSPLTSAYKRAYIGYVTECKITRKHLEEFMASTGLKLHFDVLPYLDWLATPEAQAALSEWDRTGANQFRDAADAEARQLRLLWIQSRVESAQKDAFLKSCDLLLEKVPHAVQAWEEHGISDKLQETYEASLRQAGVTADDLADLAGSGYDVPPAPGLAPAVSEEQERPAGYINPDDIGAMLDYGMRPRR